MDVARKRLIDANALKTEILAWAVCINKPTLLVREDTMFVIDQAPTVDAVEVIRCRNCKYYKTPVCHIHTEYPWEPVRDDDFCSRAER